MSAPDKPRYPRAAALAVAKELCAALAPHCEWIKVAGSLRRRKPTVGDVEILYVSKREAVSQLRQADLLVPMPEPQYRELAEICIAGWLAGGLIKQRLSILGQISSWGAKNKHAVHCATKIPVDFFAATMANRWNYLVCRTGSAENNMTIASAAQKKGWQWHPYDEGFTDDKGHAVPVTCEQDVYRFAGLDYKEPWER